MSPHPTLPGSLADGSVSDTEQSWPVSESEEKFASGFIRLTVDTIVAPDDGEHDRAVVQPHGAVGILAIDDDDRVLLVQQYRHPVRHRLLELPAGTLDVAGEAPAEAAARELAEEADVVADAWRVLLTMFASPGYSSEAWTVYGASSLRPVPDEDRTDREAEEADMQVWWLPFEQAVASVLAGRITDAMTTSGLLAEHARRLRA